MQNTATGSGSKQVAKKLSGKNTQQKSLQSGGSSSGHKKKLT
jgi:hypothetical protein